MIGWWFGLLVVISWVSALAFVCVGETLIGGIGPIAKLRRFKRNWGILRRLVRCLSTFG